VSAPTIYTAVQADQSFSFFKEQDFPDLTIKFSGTEISAHRYLIGRKSSWFKKACSGQFKVGLPASKFMKKDSPETGGSRSCH